jgi:hypothetical protein
MQTSYSLKGIFLCPTPETVQFGDYAYIPFPVLSTENAGTLTLYLYMLYAENPDSGFPANLKSLGNFTEVRILIFIPAPMLH